MIRLQALEGSLEGQEFSFDGPAVVIGRSPECELSVDSSLCSRQHARLERDGSTYRIVDLDSTNGTVVNGERTAEAELQEGDRFSVGDNLFVLLADTPVEEDEENSDFGNAAGNAVIQGTQTLNDIERRLREISERAGQASPGTAELSGEQLEDLQRANRQLHAVYSQSRAISSTLRLDELYNLVAENVLENIDEVERVCVFVAGGESTELSRVVTRTRDAETPDAPVSRDVLGRVAEERVGILATDALDDDRFEDANTIIRLNVRSLLCVPLATPRRFVGAIYAENCAKISCFTQGDLELLTVLGNQAAAAIENALLYDDVQRSFYETIRSLGNALEAKDKYTRGHSARVARYAVGIAREMGLADDKVEEVRIAAELHDIGKIAIRETIINTSNKLTDEEFEIIKQHPALGVKILKPIRFLEPILPAVLHHHERYNGKGYPNQLAGENIPLAARVLNLADAFDAMTTQRSYNKPRTIEGALEHCLEESGVSFDSSCVHALVRYIHHMRAGGASAAGAKEQTSEVFPDQREALDVVES